VVENGLVGDAGEVGYVMCVEVGRKDVVWEVEEEG
jgi:hypothetical protein